MEIRSIALYTSCLRGYPMESHYGFGERERDLNSEFIGVHILEERENRKFQKLKKIIFFS